MHILKLVSKHSTILMPVASIIGLLFPNISNAILPWLPQILFFLMFFTLLGIAQSSLLATLSKKAVWRFAFLQNILITTIVIGLGYVFGIESNLLLALAAVGATAPLFGSGAIVNAMGFDALLAMAKTIAATLIMPLTLFIVLTVLAEEGAYLDIAEYGKRLLIYIITPMLLSIVVKKLLPDYLLRKYYPKIAQFNVLLVLAFPLGLMGGFRQTFDNSPTQAIQLLLMALLLVMFIFALTYLLHRHQGKQMAVIAATVSSGRNVLLTYTIAMPFLGTLFLPLIGALQLPMFFTPFFAKKLLNNQNKS
ncbi:lantibiotic ABC transporter permease [Psychrobacter sp. HD31]|uniref:lantibiotic ABC transporter permease n=1 Tax=Psychrobacter sp. HD31 TaxID=3112003 RepID=UPI003DA1D179